MSMNKLFFSVVSLLALTSCASEYKIEGSSSVSRLDGKMLFIKVPDGDRMVKVDSAEVIHGIFKMEGVLDSSVIASLYMDDINIMPFVGKACEAAGHIFVDKSGPKKVKETIEHARNVLQNGTSLVVFPEGARTFTGHMGYFKKGAFQLADELQLPVVPLTIVGSFNVLPRTGGFVSWHPMTLIIHKPIYPQSQGIDNIKTTMEEAYKEIEKSLPEEYQGKVDNPDQ